MKKLNQNIIANYVGRFWSFFSGFLFTPLYIYYLGFERFSIISFALVINSLMSVLDAGISSTLSREFALKDTSHSVKVRIFSTFEILYFAISLLIVVSIYFLSHQIAFIWLNLDKIDPVKVSYYLKIMGIGIAFEFLSNFYCGGLMGLEQQVKANYYKIGWGISRNAFVVIPLIYYPFLDFFFIWQAIVSIIYAFLIRRALIIQLNAKIAIFRKPIIDKEILMRTWKFAGGIMLIGIVASFNTQMDKLAISKILPIKILGYYVLAFTLSQSIVSLVTPISIAILPRFTALFSEKKIDEASNLFNKYSLLVSIFVLSFGCNIIVFSKDLIWIWTGNIVLANNAYQYIPYLTIGSIMLSLQYLPYSISIANGYTKINNYIGIFSLILTLPGYWIMTKYYGADGAAIIYAIVQILITPIYIYFVCNRFLSKRINYYQALRNFIFPLFIALFIAYLFDQFYFFEENRINKFIWIGLSTVMSLIFCSLYLFRKIFTGLLFNKF